MKEVEFWRFPASQRSGCDHRDILIVPADAPSTATCQEYSEPGFGFFGFAALAAVLYAKSNIARAAISPTNTDLFVVVTTNPLWVSILPEIVK